MKKIVSVMLAATTMTLAGTSSAREVVNDGANFRVDIPDHNWIERARGEVLVAEHKDKTVVVEIIGHKNQTMTARAAGFDTGKATAHLAGILGEVKLGGAVREIRHNTMPCVEYFGTGKHADGRTVDFLSLTCKTADTKGFTAVMFATPGGLEQHKGTARVVFDSMKPIR